MDGIAAYLFAALVLLGVAGCATLALRRMWSLEGLPDMSRLDDSPEQKYAAMSRLFSQRDLEFLRSQTGYTPQLEADFRRRRAEVFRLYLRSMQRDFDAIHAAARLMAARGLGGPELSGRLVELPVIFRRTVLKARWQVFLYERGWAMPTMSIAPAVEAMFKLRGHIDLAAVASAA
jgi:hypothetical protein